MDNNKFFKIIFLALIFPVFIFSFSQKEKEVISIESDGVDINVTANIKEIEAISYKWTITEISPNNETIVFENVEDGNSSFRWFPGVGKNHICLEKTFKKTGKVVSACEILIVTPISKENCTTITCTDKNIIKSEKGNYVYTKIEQ